MKEKDALEENADVLRGIEDIPPTGNLPLPERQLFALERARREALAARVPQTAKSEEKIVRPVFFRRMWQAAAAVLVVAALGWYFLPHPSKQPAQQVARVVVTSPGDSIGTTRPTIAWNSKDTPGQRYDVWILPAEGDYRDAKASPALFTAKNVVSPVEFSSMEHAAGNHANELQADRNYRVLVCLADGGRMAGIPVPFRVVSPTR